MTSTDIYTIYLDLLFEGPYTDRIYGPYIRPVYMIRIILSGEAKEALSPESPAPSEWTSLANPPYEVRIRI